MLRLCLIACSALLVQSAPQSAVLPADLTAEACPNYPFCGPTPLEIPNVSRFQSWAPESQFALTRQSVIDEGRVSKKMTHGQLWQFSTLLKICLLYVQLNAPMVKSLH